MVFRRLRCFAVYDSSPSMVFRSLRYFIVSTSKTGILPVFLFWENSRFAKATDIGVVKTHNAFDDFVDVIANDG